jgi:hypothetical protein
LKFQVLRYFKQVLIRIVRRVLDKDLVKIYGANETGGYKKIANTLLAIIQKKEPEIIDNKTSCEIVCFSKDRAIQLHALLSSYYDYIKNPVKIHVLYTCSSKNHKKSYEELISIFKEHSIEFIFEKDFKDDLNNILDLIKTSKIFFMTDDAVFIDEFDMNDFTRYNPLVAIPSLTKGLDLTYCFSYSQNQDLPQFINDTKIGNGMKCWIWSDAVNSPDWSYPLSVDGTLYDKIEIQELIRNTGFKAPNSLEWGLQVYIDLFRDRKGICFDKVKYINIPCNIVQNECDNKFTGTYDPEFLLQQWESGNRIRYEEFLGQDCKIVQQAKFNFVKR